MTSDSTHKYPDTISKQLHRNIHLLQLNAHYAKDFIGTHSSSWVYLQGCPLVLNDDGAAGTRTSAYGGEMRFLVPSFQISALAASLDPLSRERKNKNKSSFEQIIGSFEFSNVCQQAL
jgi:hypothetical protein